ncbi:hypothetical protein MMC17_004672 [Xylographa soralifera]|nr:hypothetical protein [Xylographa soralifera]
MCYYRARKEDGTVNRETLLRMCHYAQRAGMCIDTKDYTGNVEEDPRRKVVICDEAPTGTSESNFSDNTSEEEELAERKNKYESLKRSGPDFDGFQATNTELPSQDSKGKKVVGNIVDKFRRSGNQKAEDTLLGSNQQRKLNTKKSLKKLFRRKTEEEPEPVPGSSQLPLKQQKK